MKGYPVTRDELFTLGGASLLSSGAFSVGLNFVNRSLDLQKDLELNQGIPPVILTRWQTREADYWTFGVVLMVLGVSFAVAGGLKILSIIRSTAHPE